MSDKPLDCFGVPIASSLGKHDFQLTTTNTSAQAFKLDEAWLNKAINAMKGLPPAEEVIHHAKLGTSFWEAVKLGVPVSPQGPPSALFGFPLYIDESLSSDVCEFRNKNGKVLKRLRLEP